MKIKQNNSMIILWKILNVEAIKFLYKATHESIALAEILLVKWREGYVRLFGDYHCTFNFHIVSQHLIQDVKLHGSLIGHNMFSFESLLGFLLPAIHGTRGLAEQYIKSK